MGNLDTPAIMAANLTTSVVSFIGTLFIIGCYLRIKELRSFAFTLVLYLSISECLWMVGNFLGNPEDGSAMCYVQGAMISMFSLSAIAWTTVIAYVLHNTVCYPEAAMGIHRSITYFMLFGWGVPLILTLLPFTTHSYGAAGPFCWIGGDNAGQFWRFMQFYFPLWTCMAYNTYVYINVRAVVGRARGMGPSKRAPLIMYPLILAVCWLLPTVNRIQNWIEPDDPSSILYFCHVLFSNSQGIAHAVAYGTTVAVRTALKRELGLLTTVEWEEEERRQMQSQSLHNTPTHGSLDDSGRRRLNSVSFSDLSDVSHQIRAAYMSTLGVFEFIGIDDSEEAYLQVADAAAWTAVPSHKAGMGATYFTMFKGFVGIGILTLPNAFLQAGYVAAVIGLVVIAVSSYEGMLLILQTGERVQQLLKAAEASGDEVGHQDVAADRARLMVRRRSSLHSVGTVDPGLQLSLSVIGVTALGRLGGWLVDFCLVTSQVGFSISYLIFIGNNVHDGLQSQWGVDFGVAGYIVVAGCLLVPLIWLRHLKRLAWSAALADVAVVFGLITVAGYSLDSLSAHPPTVILVNMGTFPLFFGSAVFAFEGVGIMIPIQQSMAEPQRFPHVIKVTTVVLVFLFSSFGGLAYMAFGPNTDAMITLNLPHNFLVLFVQLLYSCGLFFSFPIMMFPAVQVLEESRFYNHILPTSTRFPDAKRLLFRTVIVLVAVIIAIVTPHFGLFVSLVGAVGCTLLQFVLPGLFHLKLFPQSSALDKGIDYTIIAFGVIGGIVSFALTMVEFFNTNTNDR